MEDTSKLNTSKLGTKEYWDDFYALENSNFKENPGDTGECWFADNDAEEKMIEFLMDNLDQQNIHRDCSMIDLGTGNGHLLFQLHEEGFNGPMMGVDYSEKSVQFAREISESQFPGYENIKFEAADIFDPNWECSAYDVVLDKGTLDAIALSGIKLDGDRSVVDVYPKVVEKLLKKDSVFLITSCNFTQEELIRIVESDSLKVWKTIDYPVFEFGGVKGTTICSIAFVKR
ncbi:Efm4p [Lachancea thermotolerans CBS 6340]|uniref:Protein-lysine N-methyltransferase EFM4 n=1 Tax=Lachancea thermotolerans (strain ATCC 56472 / CBS 6340 / NRRL Y-8284) TaxID=559295 RepID=C5DBQ9_LACTC|nr:KLTH0A04642p [Lachancea thermotolerans CBS 6340]CAR21216.1 KLTH0A04642p [Lachancea thermotolerans CBS 6340]